MRIWYFDKNSSELIPTTESDKGQDALPSPRENGVYLESIYSTRIKPQEYGKNEIPCFDGKKWILKPDYRFINAWYKKDGSTVSITDIGVEPDGEFVETAPEGVAQPVWDEETDKWREITEKELYAEFYASDKDKAIESMRHECQLALENKYFRKELVFKDRHARADKDSKELIVGYMAEISLGTRTFPLHWITCENDNRDIENMDELKALVSAMSAWVEGSIFTCRSAKDAIDDAANFEGSWAAFTAFRDAEI